MYVLEVGIKLNKSKEFYDNVLKNNGLECVFKVTAHDIYYTNRKLDGFNDKYT